MTVSVGGEQVRPARAWSALFGPLGAAALGGAAIVAGPLTSYGTVMSATGAVVICCCVLATVMGWRRCRRERLVANLTLGLGSLIGPVDRVTVAARRWRGGLVGTPRVVTVGYDGQARTHDPKWLPTLKEVLRTRLGSTWSVDSHDERQCLIRLSAAPAVRGDVDEYAAERARVERNVLKLLGPTASVTGVQMRDGRACRVSAKHEDGPRFAPSGYRARIERTLTEVMPGRWRGVWEMEADRVTFEVRPALPKNLWLPPPTVENADHLLRNYTKARIRLAVDEDGEELAWFPARVPHLLVTGATGSGKTSLGSGVVGQFAAHGWPVWISDAKRVEFIDWRGYPNVQIVATTVAEQVAMIHRALELVEYRYALVDAGLAKISDFTPLVVVLDEFAELREDLLEWYPQVKPPGRGVDSKPPTLRQVGRLGRKARTARVHLCVLLQRPDVAFLGGEALAIDTPIATPTGWTTMGAIEVGQYVFGEDGRPVRVSAATEVTEGRPCYRVTFSDGSIIVTDGNHLWLARSALQRAGDLTPAHSLPREIRWPTQAALAAQLVTVAVDNREVTVTEFEREFGGNRLTLLRTGINDGRWGLRPAGRRPGEAGRFSARTYRRADLIGALRTELASPAPTWHQVAPQIVTTAEMAKTLRYRDARSNWSVQVGEPLELPEANLPVDPWLLGYWLGDGHKANATIATNDDEVLERIRALGYRVQHSARFNYGITTGGRGGRQRPTLVGALRALNLLHNKHIPNSYLRASARQRAELLAGLLDADGTCAVRSRGEVASGQVSFISSDRRLIDGVAELIASLGFIPTVRQARGEGFETTLSSVAYGRPLREGWVVRFTPDRQVFGIGRKQRMLQPALTFPRRATTRQRYVVDVEPVASVPVRCITVDSPNHLYLAGRAFIPTHNCRDNFGQRVSMGRLSPQGAIMMWENASTGVTLPRDVPGRAMATNAAGAVVEAQCYRFPDMHAVEGTGEHEVLARLRPQVSAHGRLVVVPAAEVKAAALGLSDLAEAEALCDFWDYARAAWVRASDRPDLDPAVAGSQMVVGDRRELASAMTLLGLSGVAAPAVAGRAGAGARVAAPAADQQDSEGGSVDEQCYLDPVPVPAGHVQVGDLLLVDEDSDHWAVAQLDPEADLVDPDVVSVFWQDFEQDEGVLSVDADSVVMVRKPVVDRPYGQALPPEGPD